MSGLLGTTVFKVPELGALERDLREKQEAKEERNMQRREREINATGAESMYSKNAHKLKAGYQGPAQGAFSEMMKAGIEYEKTGSSQAKADFDKWNQKLNKIMSVGSTVTNSMLNEYQGFYSRQGEGYAASAEQVDQEFGSKINRNVNWKIENGDIVLESGDGYVPFEQHTMFSDKINPDNSFIIPRDAKTGRYIVPTSFIMDRENVGVLSRSKDATEAYKRLDKQMRFRIESDPNYFEDVALYAEIARGHISGKEPISIQMKRDAVAKMQDPENYEEALNLYSSAIKERIDEVYNQFKEDKVDPTSPEALAGSQESTESSTSGEKPKVKPADDAGFTFSVEPGDTFSQERRVDMQGALNQAPVTMNKDFSLSQRAIQSYIDKYSDGKAPITAQDVFDVSAKYGVPVEFILAQGRLESNFGTKGRGARTSNIYNVGNTTAGDTMRRDSTEQKKYSKDMGDWINGLESYADLMSRRYKPEDGDWSKLLEEFVNDDGNRYAADTNYEKTLKDIISGIYKLDNEKSVSSQEGFDADSARKKYNY